MPDTRLSVPPSLLDVHTWIANDCITPIGMGHPAFFEDPDYAKIVEAHKANPAQIVISWLVQRGIATIPKSANVERQKANITVSVNN